MISAQHQVVPSARAGRRKADSRRRLEAAARRLFIERGYHATRPQDIARAADVGHGTFYLHFADKRACFLAFAEAARDVLNALLDYAEQNPGVLKAAMTDVSVIASDGSSGVPLIERWAQDWAMRI